MKIEGYRLIWQGEDKNRLALGENLFGVGATDAAAFFGEVLHVAVFVLMKPFFEHAVVYRRLARSNASQDESQLARFVFNGLLEVGQVDLRFI